METFIQEPLFELEEPAPKKREDGWFLRNEDGELECPHCHDTGGFIWNDHSRVFNGWCAKRLFLNSRGGGWQRSIDSGDVLEYLDPKKYNQKHYGQKWIDMVTELAKSDIGWLNSKGWEVVDQHDERNWS
jgi:hypothetical protein